MSAAFLAACAACAASAVLAGCVITRPPKESERPRWRLAGDATFDAGCALGRAFIRKSGKTGFGVTLQWRSRGDCNVAIEAVKLQLEGGGTITVPPLAPVALPGRSVVYTWLPVPFDNNTAWNDGYDRGTLELGVAVAGAPATPWRIAVQQQ